MAVTHSGSHQGSHLDHEGNEFGADVHKSAGDGEHTHKEVDSWHNPWTDSDELHPHKKATKPVELAETSGRVVDQP